MEIGDLTLDALRAQAREWAEKQLLYRCIMCGYVGRQHDFFDGSVACPSCNDSGRYRQSFPVNINYPSLLQSIHLLYHVPDENVQSMVVNLFVTVYELWFEELTSYYLLNTGVSGRITDYMIGEARSFERRKRLFGAIANTHFDSAVERIGKAQLVARFEHYVRVRNMMVHHGKLKIEKAAVKECLRLIENLAPVFRKLNNEYLLWKDQ